MKYILPLVLALVTQAAFAGSAANGLPTNQNGLVVSAPDGGSTFLLLSVAVLGLAMAARKRFLK